MMFHDSRDCRFILFKVFVLNECLILTFYLGGRDLQITLDILRSKEGYIGTLENNEEVNSRAVPLYFSNPDIVSTQKNINIKKF